MYLIYNDTFTFFALFREIVIYYVKYYSKHAE